MQKFLARAGIASRRKSEELISGGHVKVNGQVVTTMGLQVDPNNDQIEVNGQIVKLTEKMVYYALNKPKGYITTAHDAHAEHTVLELVPNEPRVFPVGRLDKDTTGLLILTNDGDIAYRLTHPKFEHEKEYLIIAQLSDKAVTSQENVKSLLSQLEKGVRLEDGMTAPARIFDVTIDLTNRQVSFHIVIHEGRKRQVRRMAEVIGLKVVNLCRLRVGKLHLGDIPPGQFRSIKKEDII